MKEQKSALESRVKRDTRSKLINAAMVEELKKRYQISYNPNAKKYFETLLSGNYFTRSWRLPENFDKAFLVCLAVHVVAFLHQSCFLLLGNGISAERERQSQPDLDRSLPDTEVEEECHRNDRSVVRPLDEKTVVLNLEALILLKEAMYFVKARFNRSCTAKFRTPHQLRSIRKRQL